MRPSNPFPFFPLRRDLVPAVAAIRCTLCEIMTEWADHWFEWRGSAMIRLLRIARILRLLSPSEIFVGAHFVLIIEI